jgi:ACS family pantothenate transporter-like MFS transporter
VAFPIVDAPQFHKGQIATIVTAIASVGIAVSITYCARRYPVLPEDDEHLPTNYHMGYAHVTSDRPLETSVQGKELKPEL